MGASDLHAVVGEGAGDDAQVPVGGTQHPAHVVGQGFVAGGVVRRIVADVERPEAGAETPDPEGELVGDPIVEVGHRQLEAVAPVADLHVRGEVIGDVGGHLQGDLGGEAVVGAARSGAAGGVGHEEFIELCGAGEVALDGCRRRGMQQERGQRSDGEGEAG